MKLNLTENLETLEDYLARHFLRNIERELPQNPRYVAERDTTSRPRPATETEDLEQFLAHPDYRGVGAVQRAFSTESGDEFELAKGATWHNDEAIGEPMVIECVRGSLWLTLGHGLREDILLTAGREYISRPGDVPVIEALEESIVRLCSVR